MLLLTQQDGVTYMLLEFLLGDSAWVQADKCEPADKEYVQHAQLSHALPASIPHTNYPSIM